MNKLSTHFRRLSSLNKIKFIVLLPVLCFAMILDNIIDLLAYLFAWATNFFKERWQELLVVTSFVLAIVVPVLLCIHLLETVPNFKGRTQMQAEKYVYTNCHEMANNFIVAEDGDVRGYVRADDRNIDRIIAVIAEYRFEDDDLLIDWLTDFKDGDYSDAVNFHNHCWKKLDGEVGYAVDLRKKYK